MFLFGMMMMLNNTYSHILLRRSNFVLCVFNARSLTSSCPSRLSWTRGRHVSAAASGSARAAAKSTMRQPSERGDMGWWFHEMVDLLWEMRDLASEMVVDVHMTLVAADFAWILQKDHPNARANAPWTHQHRHTKPIKTSNCLRNSWITIRPNSGTIGTIFLQTCPSLQVIRKCMTCWCRSRTDIV